MTHDRSTLRLAGVTALLLPDEARSDLLRACLDEGPDGASAYRRWAAGVDSPVEGLTGEDGDVSALAPLLYHARRHDADPLDSRMASHLRIATVNEGARTNAYLRVLGRLADAVGDAGLTAATVGDAAVATTAYPDPSLRHAARIDLLVRSEDLAAVARASERAGFAPSDGSGGSGRGPDGSGDRSTADPEPRPPRRLTHESGMPLWLRTDLVPTPRTEPTGEVLARARPGPPEAAGLDVVAPGDLLVGVLGRAALASNRGVPWWMADTWYLFADGGAEQYGAPDPRRVCSTAEAHGIALPLVAMLGHVADELDLTGAAECADALVDVARESGRLEREITVSAAHASPGVGPARLLTACNSWRERADVLAWLVVPSKAYLEATDRSAGGRAWPVLALRRPVRFAARRLRRVVRP